MAEVATVGPVGEGGDGDTSVLHQLKVTVDKLYEFRDHYFEQHGIDQAAQKAEDVKAEVSKAIKLLDELQEICPNKAQVYMQRGRALNVTSDFDPEALDMLSKAVKLDPSLVEAWNNLGECYWKKGDVEAAKNCFSGALTKSRNKVSLRNLSMVLRQLGTDPVDRLKNIQESVTVAKEAVQLDVNDGTSWFVLGNAYLSVYFSGDQNLQILKQCMSAYNQAEGDVVAKSNPDLHFNKATVLRYEEQFQLALMHWDQASALDPTWDQPSMKQTQLLTYLSKVADMVHHKGKLKAKRLQSMLKSLSEKDLGPYGGGSFESSTGKKVPLESTTLANLATGLNKNKLVLGKVVCSVTTEETIPFTFALTDKEGTCFAVTLYNVAPNYGTIVGDSVAIPEPFLQHVDFQHKDKKFQFSLIRVETPLVLVVNSRKLGLDKQAPTVLACTTMSE
ncbi:tetratricopeptide repeat protein 5-like [Branchiostoma floridae]|uniref:Tetratricopeptide repeat protein 5-like n=1 Tax=Branchiostoma floridae TaxID=7739 RepID=A0A9J7LAE4_BRAFL|nr:tetratricopeptide repeat protein 5-like [Branchiostoma floridae]